METSRLQAINAFINLCLIVTATNLTQVFVIKSLNPRDTRLTADFLVLQFYQPSNH